MDAWRTLVFLCLACLDHGALSCPALCKCYHRKAEVVCNEVPMTEFPSAGLPKTTTMLTIQFTNITSVSERHLNATPLLQGLHLYSNNLQNLSCHLLRGVPHIDTLDLTQNKLSHLPEDVFTHPALRSLVLKKNQISTLDAPSTPFESALTWLDLSGNHLAAVPTTLLQKLPRLESLDFSHNHLEKLPANSLSALTKLERLNLLDNNLRSLDASTFHSTQNLTYLFLAQNRLEQLPGNLLHNLHQLKVLSLDNNQLSHIPPGLLDHLPSLEEEGLDLSANPWLCDRDLEYLWRWVQKNKEKLFLPQTVTCAGPQSLVGRPVMSLTESELNLQS